MEIADDDISYWRRIYVTVASTHRRNVIHFAYLVVIITELELNRRHISEMISSDGLRKLLLPATLVETTGDHARNTYYRIHSSCTKCALIITAFYYYNGSQAGSY